MSANHTPGPWFHESADRGNRHVIRFKAPHYTGRGEVLAQQIERPEDARLMAAAPVLADALEGLLASTPGDNFAQREAARVALRTAGRIP